MFLKVLLFSFSFLFLSTAYPKPNCFDDSDHNVSHWTKNDMGKSSYHCGISGGILQILLKRNEISKNDTVLDFGAGYGCITYELTKLGFKNVVVSDIESKNLKCLLQHQNKHFFKHKPNIRLLKGDILHNGQYESMNNGSIGLVYARNVIHLMEANDIIQLLIISHKKLKNKGIIVIEYENNRQDQLSEMINTMSKEISAVSHTNNIQDSELHTVKKYYEESGCSFDDYLKVNYQYRSPGFPCQFHGFLKKNNNPVMYHYIDQKRLIALMTKLKFNVFYAKSLNNRSGTIYIFAQKEM